MRNLLNFLSRYNNLIIFLILEGVALYLLATGNTYHNTRLVNGIRGLTLKYEQKIQNTRTFLNLRQINDKLASENVALKAEIDRLAKQDNPVFFSLYDSLHKQKYQYTTCKVIHNSVNKQKNFFTLNKGRRLGLDVDMAVEGPEGAAGIIVGCSDDFSVAMSLLNIDFRLSVRLKSSGYFGSLTWDGHDYRLAVLNEIPQNVSLFAGDTVETTGYSAIFPEGIMVGTVNEFEKTGVDFYKISVLLATDFKKLNYVDVMGNLRKKEQLELETLYQ